MASGGSPATTTTSASIRVVNESPVAVVVVPDWKRELIERRKSLGKAPSAGHSHSQSSKDQSSAVPSSSGVAASLTTTDSTRSHTATPATTSTTTTTTAIQLVDSSAGKSFDQVTSPLSSSVVGGFSTKTGSPNSLRATTTRISSSSGVVTSPSFGSPSDREEHSVATSTAITDSLAQQKNLKKHHDTNCAANNNNNQKRNTDDVDSEPPPHSVRSASSPSSSSSSPSPFQSAVVVGSSAAGRAVKKPELPATVGRSSFGSSKDSSFGVSEKSGNIMVAQEVCESAALDASLAMGGSVVMGQCNSPDGATRSDFEAAEELKYGPGIVQKLRSRFMSYTMRLNAAKNQRPSLQNMRRATSLNNLLDDDEDSTRTVSPVHSAAGGVGQNGSYGQNVKDTEDGLISHRHSMGNTNGFGQRDMVAGSGVGNSAGGDLQCDGLKKYQNEMLRSRQLRRGNDSLKRARSVETLRYDSKAWERDIQMTTNNNNHNHNLVEAILTERPSKEVTMEERIVNAKERGDPRPTRLKPFIDVTERPPPDLVKTTLMKFEATANRRGRAPTSRNGEVAAKVAILEKPAILHPKPPLSPKKPAVKPRTSLQANSPLAVVKQHQQQTVRSPSPLLINVDMSYKQSTPASGAERRKGTNLLTSPPQTPPDLINNIGVVRKESNGGGAAVANNHHLQQLMQQPVNNGGYESPITQLTNKLKSMQLQSPVVVGGNVGGGGVAAGGPKSVRLIDNGHGVVGGGRVVVGGCRSGTDSTSNSSASTATSSATSSPVPHSAASGSYYLNGCGSAAGRLELGDVSAEDCYEYRDYDDDEDDEEEQVVEGKKHHSGLIRGQFESTVVGDEEANETDDGDDERRQEATDEDHVDNTERAVRLINKTDLQNIGQAGTTQEFRFGGSGNKSHLPAVPPRTGAQKKPEHTVVSQGPKMRFVPTAGVGGGATAVELRKKNGHSAVQDIVLLGEGDGPTETDVDECKTTTALLIKQIKEARKCGGTGLRDSQVNNGGVVINHSSLNSNGNGHNNNISNHSVRNGNSDTTSTNRQREIEKNLINVGKSELKEQQPQQSSVVGPAAAPAKKKSWQEEPQANTMVFNFSKRKDVPDYIDSDGMILLPHRKRELPKPGESGFVVLGDISLETSTDPDDAWTMGPPSPCNIVFENDNVIIEGKSNLRKQLNRSKQWSIRFDDSLTSTFEYVSESSFMEAYNDDVDSSSDSQMSMHTGQKFMAISSAPLGSYTPMKGSVASNFELGVTKSPSPGSSSVSMSPSPTQSKEEQARNGDNSLNGGDPESLQYLKPASDEETVAWSEGTRATDMLF